MSKKEDMNIPEGGIARPLILLSNDDGVGAMGLEALISIVRDLGDVIVVAPEGGRSGASLSITTTIPVRYKKIREEAGLKVYSCTGTPCDCVKMALENLVPRKPDLILGGINHGDNAAVNAHYSGTIAIAIEGTMKEIPSIGLSSCAFRREGDFLRLSGSIRRMVSRVLSEGLPYRTYLNVNFPDVSEFKGTRICKMGMGDWINEWVECEDPRGGRYYWMAGSYENYNREDTTTDSWALEHGYIAVTPITLDLTAYSAFDQLKSMLQTDDAVSSGHNI